MYNLKEIESDYKGDYIYALYHFIKDDISGRGYPDLIVDISYNEFYSDVDSSFTLDELRNFCSLLSFSSDKILVVSFICFFEELFERLNKNLI